VELEKQRSKKRVSSISFFNINKKMLEREGETPHFSSLFIPLTALKETRA
tara:strand:- start:1775 stop:1924 length:150 start_codon:yes stop_codon:yes gene_type:complete